MNIADYESSACPKLANQIQRFVIVIYGRVIMIVGGINIAIGVGVDALLQFLIAFVDLSSGFVVSITLGFGQVI
jgi:hypothetical protein